MRHDAIVRAWRALEGRTCAPRSTARRGRESMQPSIVAMPWALRNPCTSAPVVLAAGLALAACHRGEPATIATVPRSTAERPPEEDADERAMRREVRFELEDLGQRCDAAMRAREARVDVAERRRIAGYVVAAVAILVGRAADGVDDVRRRDDPNADFGAGSPLSDAVVAERSARDRYVATVEADFRDLQALLDEAPDPAEWTTERWRAFHEKLAETERDCRALAHAQD